MALIDDVKIVCDRLAPLGWRSLLLQVTVGRVDILQPTSVALKTELTKRLTAIGRTVQDLLTSPSLEPKRLHQDLRRIVCGMILLR